MTGMQSSDGVWREMLCTHISAMPASTLVLHPINDIRRHSVHTTGHTSDGTSCHAYRVHARCMVPCMLHNTTAHASVLVLSGWSAKSSRNSLRDGLTLCLSLVNSSTTRSARTAFTVHRSCGGPAGISKLRARLRGKHFSSLPASPADEPAVHNLPFPHSPSFPVAGATARTSPRLKSSSVSSAAFAV